MEIIRKDNYFIKIKFVFFLSLFAAVSIMKRKRSAFIYLWYQTDTAVSNISIHSADQWNSAKQNMLGWPPEWARVEESWMCRREKNLSFNKNTVILAKLSKNKHEKYTSD
jgi:hypothetical protein